MVVIMIVTFTTVAKGIAISPSIFVVLHYTCTSTSYRETSHTLKLLLRLHIIYNYIYWSKFLSIFTLSALIFLYNYFSLSSICFCRRKVRTILSHRPTPVQLHHHLTPVLLVDNPCSRTFPYNLVTLSSHMSIPHSRSLLMPNTHSLRNELRNYASSNVLDF